MSSDEPRCQAGCVRRLRAARVPATFFLGLALICASLLEFQRFPEVEAAADWSDHELEARGDRVTVADLLLPAFAVLPREEVTDIVDGFLAAAGIITGLGLLLLILGRRLAGGLLLTLGPISGALALGFATLNLRTSDQGLYTCMGRYKPQLPGIFLDGEAFVILVSVLVALSWLVLQRKDGLVIRPATFAAVGIALAMIGVTALGADFLTNSLRNGARFWGEPHEPSRLLAAEWGLGLLAGGVFVRSLRGAWITLLLAAVVVALGAWLMVGAESSIVVDAPSPPPVFLLAVLIILGAGGVVLSLFVPLYSSRFVSLLVLAVGVALSVPAVAVAHDERHEFHDAPLVTTSAVRTVSAASCEPVELAVAVLVSPEEITISGRNMGAPNDGEKLEEPVFDSLHEKDQQYLDLCSQAGDIDCLALSKQRINLVVDETTPMPAVIAIGRAIARTRHHKVDLITYRRSPGELWTRSTIHNHGCAVHMDLSNDGRPMSDFPDWPALVRAADGAAGALRLSPR